MPIWGIDLGGTKIEGVVLNDDKVPKILVRKRIDTEAAQGYHHIISRIRLLIDTMAHELGYFPEKIGMGRFIGSQRSNGFSAMIKQMKLYALAINIKDKK